MKSLLAILALAVVTGAGYWKFRNPDAGMTDLGAQASGQAGQFSSLLGFGGADTSQLEADLATSQSRLEETATALDANRQVLDDALQRIASLETKSDETTTTLDQTTVQLDETKTQLDQTVTQLDEATTRLDQTTTKLDATATQLNETDTKLDTTAQALASASTDFESRESSFNERLQAIGGKVEQGVARSSQLQPLQQRMANLEASFNELDNGLSGATSALTQRFESDLATQTSAREASVTEISEVTQQVSARVDNLEATIGSVAGSAKASASSADLEELKQQVAELQSEIQRSDATLTSRLDTALDEKIAGLSANIEEKRQIDADNSTRLLRQSVNRMDNRIKAISAASGEADAALELTSALDDRIDEVENSIAGIEQNPAIQRIERRLTAEIEQTNSSLEAINGSVASLDSSVSQVSSSVTAINSSISEMDSSINSIKSSVADSAPLQQRLLSTQQQVTALQARIDNRESENSTVTAAMDTRLSDLDQRIGGLESSETQLAAALPKIQAVEQNSFAATEGAELASKVQSLESAVATLDDTVIALRTSAAEADSTDGTAETTAQSEAVKSELEGINQRLQEIDVQLVALSGATETGKSEQVKAELVAQITELENRLAQQTQQPDQRLASEVDQLNKKLSVLEQQRLAANQSKQLGKPNEYKIYFGKDSTSISGDAEKVLKSFISQEQNRASSVSIFGFTDRSGNAAYNQRLALRRANGVRSFLIQQGFDFRKINAVDGLGEDPAASKLDDGQEDANQRSVVLYAYQK